ncbi:hypothetical protein [Thermococcus waiotapuensis]|uniref:Glycosyltransferase RgtA/B/C/D-like domain-containing protein n=1 Tax=Thermococcus waiotapuensis TaxID=90909 RepID=A0AAE4NU61_9EURY|nr:hypothetical protein [Thermococcus waiotapuensis]MDV3104413.1 hypothetical protein [Thermococcus waiotapuensis]
MRRPKSNPGKERSFYVLLVILLLSLSIRLYIAPYSTGSDIPQFYGFAGTMLRHPLDFYSYADGKHWEEEGWPYNWPYVYGPVLVYLMALLRVIVGDGAVKFFWDSSGYHVFASTSWIMAVKSLFIIADVGVGILLYLFLRKKSEKLALGVSSLYLFNPMVIYVSSVYGMFDGLALLPFLLGLYFVENGRKNLGYGLIGFSLAVKHTIIFPALVVLWDELLDKWKTPGALKESLGSFVAGTAIPFLPFLLKPASLLGIPDLLQGMKPDYTYPIAYNLNGIVSLLTFVHEISGLNTLFYMRHWAIFSVLALMGVLFTHYRLRNLRVSIALAYAAFLLTYWRVNTQYSLPLIAFLLLALPELDWPSRVVMFLPTVPPTLWPIMFPTSFWFHVHIEHPNWNMVKLIDRFTLMIFDTGPFVVLSILFTLSLFALLVWMLALSFELRRCNG